MASGANKQKMFGGETSPVDQIRKDAEAAKNETILLIATIERLNAELKKISTASGGIKGMKAADNSRVAQLEKENAALAESLKLLKEEQAIQKAKRQAEKERQAAENEKIRLYKEFQKEQEKKIANDKREDAEAQKREARYNKEIEQERKRNEAYQRLKDRISALRHEYLNLAAAGQANTKRAREIKPELDRLVKTYDKINSSVGVYNQRVGKYTQAVVSGFRYAANAVAQFGLTISGIQFLRNISDAVVNYDRLSGALKTVITNTKDYERSLRFLSDLSKKYGQDLIILSDTYKNFIASSNASNLSLHERNRIYESVIKTGGALRLSNEQVEGSLRAISQMFSKGNVQAEELRGELGERLPGAFSLAAKAMGVTDQQLNKMLKDGEVLAVDLLPKLATELDKTYGEKATENVKTISGAWNVLKTRLIEYGTEVNRTNSVTAKIAGTINWVGNNIDTVINYTKELIKQYVFWKTAQKALQLGQFISGLRAGADGTKSWSNALKNATTANTEFGKSLRNIGFSVAIDLLIQLTYQAYRFASGIAQAEENMARFNKQIDKGAEAGRKSADKIFNAQEKAIAELERQAKIRIKNGESEKKVNADLLKQKEAVISKSNDEIKANIINLNSRKAAYKESSDQLKKLDSQLKSGQITAEQYDKRVTSIANSIGETSKRLKDKAWTDFGYEGIANSADLLPQLEAHIQGVNANLKEQYMALGDNTELYKDLNAEIGTGIDKTDKHTKELKANETQLHANNTALEDYRDLLMSINELNNEIEKSKIQFGIEEIDKKIEKEMQNMRYQVSRGEQYNNQIIVDLMNQRHNLAIQLAQKELDFKNKSVDDAFNNALQKDIEKLDADKKKLLDDINESKWSEEQKAKDRLAVESSYQQELQKIIDFYRVKKEESDLKKEANRQEFLAAEKQANEESESQANELNDATVESYDESLNRKLSKLDDFYKKERIRRLESKAGEDEIAKRELEDLESHLQEQIKLLKDAGKETTDLELQLAETRRQIRDKEAELNQAFFSEVKKLAEKSLEELLNMWKKRSEEHEKMIDRDIEASKRAEDQLIAQANAGSDTAKQSLAEERIAREQLMKQKEQEQKKQEAIEKAKIAYQIVGQLLSSGKNVVQATGQATASMSVIDAFISKLKGFYSGTKRTVGEELGDPILPGKDGHIIRVDGAEKILNPELSRMTGSATTDQIVDGYLFSKEMSRYISAGLMPQKTDITHDPLLPMQLAKLDKIADKLDQLPKEQFSEGIREGVLSAWYVRKSGNTQFESVIKSNRRV